MDQPLRSDSSAADTNFNETTLGDARHASNKSAWADSRSGDNKTVMETRYHNAPSRANAGDQIDSAAGSSRPQNSEPAPGLLTIARELRDMIFDIAVQDDDWSFHLKKPAQPFGGVHLMSNNEAILANRQFHQEYAEALQKHALSMPATRHGFGKNDELVAQVKNMRFDNIIAFLEKLPEKTRSIFWGDKLVVQLDFTSLNVITRSTLLNWLQICGKHGIAARYTMSRGRDGRYSRFKAPSSLYFNIYDLFAEQGDDDSEEEKIFTLLQEWYAVRELRGVPQRCGRGQWAMTEREKKRATEQGLRKVKSPADCEKPVRPAEPCLS